jgi:hypothetical protein
MLGCEIFFARRNQEFVSMRNPEFFFSRLNAQSRREIFFARLNAQSRIRLYADRKPFDCDKMLAFVRIVSCTCPFLDEFISTLVSFVSTSMRA